MARPKILVVRSQKLQATAAGGQQRGQALERGFNAAGDVTVVYADPAPGEGDVDRACNNVAMRGAWKRWPTVHLQGHSDARQVVAAADVIFVQDFAAFWWTGIADSTRTIIDIDNIRSQFWQQGLRNGSLPKLLAKRARYWWARWSERAVLDRFRFALVCSEADLDYLQHPAVRVVPNCYQPHPLMETSVETQPWRDLLFVGTLFYPPNLEGLRWFVDRILPLIRLQRPEATLTIVGRTPDPLPGGWEWLKSPGVVLVGTVPDVGPYVRSARIEVCPLLLGGGTRIKLIESLAFGTPAVATTIGAYGLSMSETEGLFRRDTPEQFANQCLELLSDDNGRRSLSVAGKAFARRHYSPQVVESSVGELVAAIVNA